MNQTTRDILIDTNQYLNKLYNFYYSCLAEYKKFKNQNSNTEASDWISGQLDIYAYGKNKQLDIINSSNFKQNYEKGMQALDSFKHAFIDYFNKYYGTSGSFEDFFDGYKIKHNDFDYGFCMYDYCKNLISSDPEFIILCTNYKTYLETYKQTQLLESFLDIVKTIEADLTPKGYPTIFFEKPDDNIKFMKRETVLENYKHSLALLKRSTRDYNSWVKKTDRAYKKCQNPNVTEEAKYKYDFFEACLSHADNQNLNIDELHLITQHWLNRLESANASPIKGSIVASQTKIWDLLSGVNIFSNKNQFSQDKIYVHENEIKYYKYLADKVRILTSMEVEKVVDNPLAEQMGE